MPILPDKTWATMKRTGQVTDGLPPMVDHCLDSHGMPPNRPASQTLPFREAKLDTRCRAASRDSHRKVRSTEIKHLFPPLVARIGSLTTYKEWIGITPSSPVRARTSLTYSGQPVRLSKSFPNLHHSSTAKRWNSMRSSLPTIENLKTGELLMGEGKALIQERSCKFQSLYANHYKAEGLTHYPEADRATRAAFPFNSGERKRKYGRRRYHWLKPGMKVESRSMQQLPGAQLEEPEIIFSAPVTQETRKVAASSHPPALDLMTDLLKPRRRNSTRQYFQGAAKKRQSKPDVVSFRKWHRSLQRGTTISFLAELDVDCCSQELILPWTRPISDKSVHKEGQGTKDWRQGPTELTQPNLYRADDLESRELGKNHLEIKGPTELTQPNLSRADDLESRELGKNHLEIEGQTKLTQAKKNRKYDLDFRKQSRSPLQIKGPTKLTQPNRTRKHDLDTRERKGSLLQVKGAIRVRPPATPAIIVLGTQDCTSPIQVSAKLDPSASTKVLPFNRDHKDADHRSASNTLPDARNDEKNELFTHITPFDIDPQQRIRPTPTSTHGVREGQRKIARSNIVERLKLSVRIPAPSTLTDCLAVVCADKPGQNMPKISTVEGCGEERPLQFSSSAWIARPNLNTGGYQSLKLALRNAKQGGLSLPCENPEFSNMGDICENTTLAAETIGESTPWNQFGAQTLLSGGYLDVLPMRLNPRVSLKYYGKLRQALNECRPGPFLEEINRVEKSYCSRFWNVLGLPMDSRLSVGRPETRLNTPLHNLIHDVDSGQYDRKKMESFLRRVSHRDIKLLKRNAAQGDTAIDLELTARYDLRVSKLLVRQRRNSNVLVHLQNLKRDFSLLKTGLIAGAANETKAGTRVKRARIVRRQKPLKAAFNRIRAGRLKVPKMSRGIHSTKLKAKVLLEPNDLPSFDNLDPVSKESPRKAESPSVPSPPNKKLIAKVQTTPAPCTTPARTRPIPTPEPKNAPPDEISWKCIFAPALIFEAKSKLKSRRRRKRLNLNKSQAEEQFVEVKGPSLLRKMELIFRFNGSKFYAVDWIVMEKLGPVYTSSRAPPCVSIETALDSCISGSRRHTLQVALSPKERTEPIPNVIPEDILKILLDRFVRMDVNKKWAVSRADMSDALGCPISEVNWIYEVTHSDDAMNWSTFCRFWNMVSINYKSMTHLKNWINDFDNKSSTSYGQVMMDECMWFPDSEIYYLGF